MDPTLWFSDRLMIAAAALLINALLGGPRTVYRAFGLDRFVRIPASLVRMLERKLNRDKRSIEERRSRGMVLLAFAVGVSVLGGFALMGIAAFTHYGEIIEAVCVALLLSLRPTADFASALARRLAAGEVEFAREELAGTAWRNAALLDSHGIARAGVETVAANLGTRVVSPLFFYVLFGLPGLFATRAITLLADTLGYQTDTFGNAAVRAQRVVHYVPSLLTGVLIAVASMVLPFARPRAAWRMAGLLAADMQPNRREIAVMAATLDLALGGPASVYAQGPWLAGAVARAEPRDVERSGLVLWTVAGLLLLGFALLLA